MKRNIFVLCIVSVYILTPRCSFPALNTSIEYRWSIRIICGVYVYNRSNSLIGNAFFGVVYIYNADYLCNCDIGNKSANSGGL